MKINKIISVSFFSLVLVLVGAGCSSATPKEEYNYNQALEPNEEEKEQIEVQEKEVISPEEAEIKEIKIQEKKLIYSRKEYIFKFVYSESFKLEAEASPKGEDVKILQKDSSKQIGNINIKLLELEDWESEKYNKVTNDEAILSGAEKVGGENWSSYLLSNSQGHLFTIGCLQSECNWILKGISFDEALGALNKDFMTGDWKSDNGDFEEISLFADGTFYSFIEGTPYDSGTWEFDKNILKLKSEAGKDFDHTFTNVSIGEGGDWIILYEGGKTYTWRISSQAKNVYGIGESVIKDVAFFHGLWQDLGKNSDLKDYNSTSYDPPRFVKIDGEGFYEEYRGKNREIEYGTGEWEFVEGYFLFYPPNEGPTDPIAYEPREKQGLLFLYNIDTKEAEVWKKL